MYDIVILTTACSRSKLHAAVLSSIPKFLSGYKCKWIIRVDQLLDETAEDTIKALHHILESEHIDLDIYSSDRDASRISWFKTTKFCINKGFEYKPKLGYLWLEDDWHLTTDKSLKVLIESSISELPSDNYYISLAGRDLLNFNPCIWSPDLFEKYMYNKINNMEMHAGGGNAERACTHTNEGRGHSESVADINMFDINIFRDAGRDWAKRNLKVERTFHL